MVTGTEEKVTVKNLINVLKRIEDKTQPIMLSCDSEGNHYSFLNRIQLETTENNIFVVTLYPQD